ncbi:hypothetical protein AVEN_38291-1 [Araneus ventricosus]|uniref:Tesmin/TSO1-like CXC domain-containing protein n=1 Tax=Araneus ventricosus TaxID=182803 RepID=A0A4Y2E8J3_ARAVE|nr:hypothetical protein AVEN_38291-1 [Araneus ventricosus]
MIPTASQEKFLANPKNNDRLISILMKKLSSVNMTCKKADEDADCLIVNSVLALSPTHPSVDVTLHQLELIMVVQTLKNNPDLLKVIEIFKNPDMTSVDAGNRFLVALYGYPIPTSDTPSLNNVLYKFYMKSSFNKSSNMSLLPTTEEAAHQHSLRVYHQIQHWFGNKKRPEDWGWVRTNSGLQPVKTLKTPAPDSILRKISCKCKKGCTGNCNCRKARLFCSVLYLHCWDNCNNR